VARDRAAAAAKEARRAGQNALARRAGIDKAALSRFMAAGTALSVAALDRLGVALGLAVCEGESKKGG